MNDEPDRILVVDDELGMREGCRRLLELEGYGVVTARDGQAGLEAFEAGGKFVAALVDLNMPRMGGIELTQRLKELDPDILVLVITAYATIETAVEATKKGAHGYIPKPFTPDELLSPVNQGLERRSLAIETRRLREEREARLLEVAFERSKSNTIIGCMTDGVLVVNRDKQIVLRNDAAARILPECAALSLPAPLDVLNSARLKGLLAEALAGGPDPCIASEQIDFAPSAYMVNACPVGEPDHEASGAVAVLRDITALRKLEVAKSTFISMVAHEIKSPLAAIEGYLNVILSGAAGHDPARDRQMMQRSLARAQGLRYLVADLMNLSAMDTGHFTIKRRPTDVRQAVAEAIDSCAEQARERRIEVTLDDGSAVPKVMGDAEGLLLVFRNLIDNATKYTPPEGRVHVTFSHLGTYVKVSVQDTGVGIAPEHKDRIFEEFFRIRNEDTQKVPGTGLGLSLVKRLVEMHQGKVSVQSQPGQGSTFCVSLPVA